MILVNASIEDNNFKAEVYITSENNSKSILLVNGDYNAYCEKIAELSKEFNTTVALDSRGMGHLYFDKLVSMGVKVEKMKNEIIKFKANYTEIKR